MRTHENTESFRKISLGSDRKFGLTFAIIFALFGFAPLLHHNSPRWLLIAVAAGFGGVAMLAPALLAPLNRAWFKLGLLLSRVVNPLVMGLMFFGAVTPLGWIMRKRGIDLLNLKLDPAASSYWVKRDARAESGALTKQF